jgi:predicted choloylglycine hydrolase
VKRLFFHLLAILMICAAFCTIFLGASVKAHAAFPGLSVHEQDGVRWAGAGWVKKYNGLKVAYFAGTPEEIGAQMYHLTVEPREQEMTAIFKSLQSMNNTGNGLLDAFRNVYAKLKFLPAFKRFIPREYLDELKGFINEASKGTENSIDELLLGNAFQDLMLVYGCSFFSAWGEASRNGNLIVGRNLDFANLDQIARAQLLAFYAPQQGYDFVTLTYPSNVGIMHGMNEKGLVIAMAYSMAVPSEMTIDGVPYTIMLRHLLQYAANVDEAIGIIKEMPRTVGLNILVADGSAREAVIVEVSAHRMAVREAGAEPFIYAANRYQMPYMKQYQASGWLSSASREKRFEQLKEFWWGRFDVNSAIEVMRDKNDPAVAGGAGLHPSIQNEGTIASMVFDASAREIWLSTSGGVLSGEHSFIGFSAPDIWNSGQPPADVLGVVPAPEETQFVLDWRQAMHITNLIYINGDYQNALELLSPIQERHPDDEHILSLLGKCHIELYNLEEARQVFERLVSLPAIYEPCNLLKAHFWLGVIYDQFGNRERAVEHYRAALAVEVPDVQDDFDQVRSFCRAGLERPLTMKKKEDR